MTAASGAVNETASNSVNPNQSGLQQHQKQSGVRTGSSLANILSSPKNQQQRQPKQSSGGGDAATHISKSAANTTANVQQPPPPPSLPMATVMHPIINNPVVSSLSQILEKNSVIMNKPLSSAATKADQQAVNNQTISSLLAVLGASSTQQQLQQVNNDPVNVDTPSKTSKRGRKSTDPLKSPSSGHTVVANNNATKQNSASAKLLNSKKGSPASY